MVSFWHQPCQCHSVSWLPGRVFSLTQVSMSPVCVSWVVFFASTLRGDQHPSRPRVQQTWRSWRLGELLPYFQGQEHFLEFCQSKGVVMWFAFLSRCCLRCSTSDAVFKIFPCCSWVTGQKTSLPKTATSHLQPPCHCCSLVGKPLSP